MKKQSILMVAVVIIGGSVMAGLLGMVFARRFTRGRQHNEIVGLVFATVALLYSVILAFVVFAVWEQFQEAARSVTNEAAAAVSAYRDTQAFPEPIRSQAQRAFRTYVTTVMVKEWKTHGLVLAHTTQDALNPVWDAYRELQPVDPGLLASSEPALKDLEKQRHLRHLAGEATLPDVFWWLIVGGGVVTIAMSYLFYLDRALVHAVLTALLAGFIAGVLCLILSLNFPFTGRVHVSRSPFKHALLEFTAINLDASGNVRP